MNLFDKNKTTRSFPGYFRIGFIALDIPPEDISTTRVSNADEITPLRAQYPMYVKSGQSRWDVTIRWTALAPADDNNFVDYSQWRDLQYIIGMFKAAPFVEVENAHLRQVFFAIDPSMEHQRMAFGLRQLRVETSPDMVNALVCTLTMTYFNYYPYTVDFGYRGSKEDAVSAYQSQKFFDYVDTWVNQNMLSPSRDSTGMDFDDESDWVGQIPGTLHLKWRTYIPVSIGQTDPNSLQEIAKLAPQKKTRIKLPPARPRDRQPVQLSAKVSPSFSDKVVSISDALDIEPDWLMQVMSFETGGSFSPTVLNRAGSGAVGLIQFTRSTASRLGTSTDELASMTAEDQLDYVYAYLKPYSGRMDNLGDVAMAVFTPLGIGRPDSFVLYQSPSRAYNQNKGLDRDGKGFITRGDYVRNLTGASHRGGSSRPTLVEASTPEHRSISDPAPVNKTLSQQGLTQTDAERAAQISGLGKGLADLGWTLDYSTEKDSFFFRDNDIFMTDETHGDIPNDLGLFPEGISVVFVNNLAQIPLSSYQYPTYQHVGPAASLISLALKSNGLYREGMDPGDQEATHPGLQAISEMAHTLEEQFHRMKVRWRSVTSIHRMQAVRVYNQVLNMMGIHSILLRDVSTATLQESPNAVALQLSASHYENFFEEVGEYLVKGFQNAYLPAFLDYLKSGQIDQGLTADDKKTIFKLLQYRDAAKNRDVNVLSKVLFDNGLGTFPAVNMPTILSAEESSLFKDILQKGKGVEINTGPTGVVPVADLAQAFSGYASRVGNDISLTDFLLIYGVDKNYAFLRVGGTREDAQDAQDVTEAAHTAVIDVLKRAQAAAGYNDAIDDLYGKLLNQAATNDPIFNQQMQLVVNDPKFRDKIKGIGNQGGPGQDNTGHGGYRDMGLRAVTIDGADNNPGTYFYDYSKEASSAIREGIRNAATTSAAAATDTNRTSSNAVAPVNSDPIQDTATFLRSVNTPDVNMAAAFPTYKLFLLEEDNSGTFYAFDDFYSYSSVIDVEIIKYRDRPHLAEIRMTNLAHLLSHKLFDATVMGKREASFNREARLPVDKNMVIAGPGVIENAGEDPLGRNYIKLPGRNLTEGYATGFNEIPLAYFPLQPGTKIEIRMGYSNNPDKLVRVFSGTVAEIEGDEILTIRAQGFQAELMEQAVDKIGTDQFWSLSTLLHLGIKKGPRFGGVKIWGDAGDAGTIMSRLLSASNARHFGHWQLLRPENPLMRGWTWQRAVGSLLESAGSTSLGPMLQTGSDRTNQNILINQVINNDGTVTKNTRGHRDFFSQTPVWAFSSWYSIDEEEDRDKTIWDFIKDVSRRYPEYILGVKDYGFPYGCDATLVFAHPRDFYYGRPYNFNEGASENKLDQDSDEAFKAWWKANGREITRKGLEGAQSVSPYFLRAVFATGIPDTEGREVLTRDPETVIPPTVLQDIDRRGVVAFEDLFNRVAHSTARQIGDFIASILPNLFVDQGKFDQSLREILAIQRQWQIYRESVNPSPFALLSPVRKYHFVDYQTIVYNGIILNDKIYNAVRIQGDTVKANETMPDHHIRVLDVDDAIIRPHDNVEGQNLTNAYAQSFLREEVGKMYRGELILRGLPKIDPWDVLFITDPSTGMMGPVEVEKVVHSFSQDQGYITIVTPRCYISINEVAGQDFARRLIAGITSANKLAGAGFNEFLQADTTAQRAALLLPAAGALTAAGTVSSLSGISASAVAAPVVSLIPAASATPPGWLAWAVIGALAVGGASYVIARNQAISPILISPIMRFGKPWIGGLEGYQVSDFWRLVHERWTQFWIDEVEPTLLSYKIAKGYIQNDLI